MSSFETEETGVVMSRTVSFTRMCRRSGLNCKSRVACELKESGKNHGNCALINQNTTQ